MQSRFPLWLQKTAVAASIVLVLWFFVVGLRQKTSNGVETFYYAARAVQSGQDIYASHSPGVAEPQYVYPPLLAVMFLPLLHLKLMSATRLWLCFNVLATGCALWIGAREVARRLRLPGDARFIAVLACSAFVLSAGEIKTEWGTGQTDTLTLLAFTLGLVWMEKRPLLAGLVLGAAANIKYQSLFAVPYLSVRGRWRAAISTVISAVGVAMLPALVLGWQRNLDSLKEAFGGLCGFAGVHVENAAKTVKLTWIRSVSVTSAMGRLLEWMQINPGKAFEAGGLIALAFLAVVWWIYRARGFGLLFPGAGFSGKSERTSVAVVGFEWVGLMVAWLAFGPEVARRHMFVLVLLNLFAVGILAAPKLGVSRRPLALGLLVFQLGLRLPPSKLTLFPHLALFRVLDGACQAASNFWNGIGGPSWCLLFYYATLLWTGLALARAMAAEDPARKNR